MDIIYLTRIFYLVAGSILLIIGILGIVLPVLPGIPFLILAAACLGRCSPRIAIFIHRSKTMIGRLKNALMRK